MCHLLFRSVAFTIWLSQIVNALQFPMAMNVGSPKGSAATPYQKKKVVVVGSGGYLGAMTFGYLQRAASLYGTGIGSIRCIGATADTSVRLNRVLSKHFTLAQADESYIKLTDLSSVDAITNRLNGWDAIIFGTDLFVQPRSVTANTYEKSPNDKAWEIYWDEPKGSFSDFKLSDDAIQRKVLILQNLILAAQGSRIQHLVVVMEGATASSSDVLSQLESCGIPFTCIITPKLTDRSSAFTFQDGLCNDLLITSVDPTSNAVISSSDNVAVCREDVAVLCVQVLQSLSWDQSRYLTVASNGPVQVPVVANRIPQRVDQQWCVNSFVLEEKLKAID